MNDSLETALLERAIKCWLSWAGQGNDSTLATKTRQRFPAELAAIRDGLFSPPNQNFSEGQEKFVEAFIDNVYRKIAAGLGITPRPFWPGEAPYAVCITHDIDRVFATYHRLRNIRKRPISSVVDALKDTGTAMIPGLRERNSFFNFSRIAAWESQLGVKSAFYVLSERRRPLQAIAKREIQHFIGVYKPCEIATELRALEDAGNEIGIHASFDSWNDATALRNERQDLADLEIKSIAGCRAHYLNFDLESSPNAIHSVGLRYDSSLGFNFVSGFRAGTCFPYDLGPLVEIPFQLMDTTLRHQFQCHSEQQSMCTKILDQVRRQGGVLVLNWHSQIMNREAFPETVSVLEQMIVSAKSDGAWIALPREICAVWKSRG